MSTPSSNQKYSMKHHFDLVQQFTGFVGVSGVRGYLDSNDDDVRNELLRMLVHTSDLYTPVRSIAESREWAERIGAEFAAQTRIEARLGLESDDFMKEGSPEFRAKMEQNFITFVARPIWTALANAFPRFSFTLQRVEDNHRSWVDLENLHKQTDNETMLGSKSATPRNKFGNGMFVTSALGLLSEGDCEGHSDADDNSDISDEEGDGLGQLHLSNTPFKAAEGRSQSFVSEENLQRAHAPVVRRSVSIRDKESFASHIKSDSNSPDKGTS